MKAIYEFPDGRVAVVSFPPGITKLALVADDAVPQDRTFRDAWKHAGNAVAVDMPKARVIYRAKADEAKTLSAQIGAAIDAARTPEELIAINAVK